MKQMQVTCSNCIGMGYTEEWSMVAVDRDANTGFHTMQRKEIVCESCKGKGYIEYAVFSIEEAKAILKHCGLSTES